MGAGDMHEIPVPDWIKPLGWIIGGGLIAHLINWWKVKTDADAKFNERVDNRLKMILEDDEKTIARLLRQEASDARKIEFMQRQIDHMRNYIVELVDAMRKHGITIPPPKDPPAAPPEDVQ